MQVNVEDLSSVKKRLHVEIPEDEVTREVDNAYKELKKTAKIKGFRPGKAPRTVLERHYKKDVNADVSSKLIQESFASAIQDNNLNIIGSPQIDPPELAYNQPYRYEATIEVRPELEGVDFKGLSLKKNLYKVQDGEIEAQLKMIQRNLTRHEKIGEDRPVREDDFVLIDYEGFKDGKPFEETQRTENYTMKVGEAQIASAVDENVVGMTPGETREFPVSFPEDDANEALAGQNLTFQVTLREIRQEVVPEIDDEMAKTLGKYETIDEIKAEIVKNLTDGYEKRSEQELNEQIFSALLERQDFEVPDTMVEYELDVIVSEAERSFQYHNMSMDQVGLTRDSLRDKYRDTALKQVKRLLILSKIIDQEKLAVSDEELDKGLADMATAFNQPVEEIQNYYKQNQDKLEYFKHSLLEKQAISLIIKNSEIEETEPEASQEAEAAEEKG